jgi:hypothetical protein
MAAELFEDDLASILHLIDAFVGVHSRGTGLMSVQAVA